MAIDKNTSITRAPKGAKPAQGDSNALDAAAKRALDVLTLARAGKAPFEAEDDGDMTDIGRIFGVIEERAEDLYIDLTALKDLKQEGGAQ